MIYLRPGSQISDEDEASSQELKKKKAKTHTNLTMEQQKVIVNWLKSKELLYNKKLDSYKDTKKKSSFGKSKQKSWV
ncbi:hypothetical protein DPMN_194313 [Dreissena polymorpha]|uniref:Uncharacterized protein n=1 Tax=Dreissena polymorpha TaxID=45954 RepID=A0A9D3Y4I4_DREPO|nr:hypothetical protein DPMN_194313 [Dreissena polymorpha]